MTYSLLAIDEKTGAYVAAAATGSLCVGGWVIRARLGAGLVASQGTAPSTLWRDDVLDRLGRGADAEGAVAEIAGADPGRDHRQLAALDADGRGAGFTGAGSVPFADHILRERLVLAGNMLSGPEVLAAMEESWRTDEPDLATRALLAMDAAEAAGGDARGLMSAALMVLQPDAAPLDLRIDASEAPLKDLRALLGFVRTAPYSDWLDEVPTARDPTRAPGSPEAAE